MTGEGSGLDYGPVTWQMIAAQDVAGLNTALNEATWIGLTVDAAARRADLLLDVLSLPPEGPAAAENLVVLSLGQVSRIAASLRDGWWNDAEAAVTPLELEELDAAVRSFGGCPVYGWEFVDPPEKSWSSWRHRLSIDARLGGDVPAHVLEVFQASEAGEAGEPRHLDLRAWFGQIRITRPDGPDVPGGRFHRSRDPLVGWPVFR
jgi:hypothetical protein